jgi:hypothetical protein
LLVAPTADHLRELIANDAKLCGTQAYRALGVEEARQISFGNLREVKKEMNSLTDCARPIISAIAALVRDALEQMFDQTVKAEILRSQDQGV